MIKIIKRKKGTNDFKLLKIKETIKGLKGYVYDVVFDDNMKPKFNLLSSAEFLDKYNEATEYQVMMYFNFRETKEYSIKRI